MCVFAECQNSVFSEKKCACMSVKKYFILIVVQVNQSFATIVVNLP